MLDPKQGSIFRGKRTVKIIFACWVVLFLFLLSVIAALRASAKRQHFLGPVISQSRLRIQYTIAPGYSCDQLVNAILDPGPFDYDYVYTREPPAWYRWLSDHHFVSAGGWDRGDEFHFSAQGLTYRPEYRIGSDGFVSLQAALRIGGSPTKLVSQDKQLIHGCPTTICVEDPGQLPGGHKVLDIHLVVHQPEDDFVYVFGILTKSGNVETDVQELKRIRDSITFLKK